MEHIRKIGKESIGQYMDIYLHAYPAFKSLTRDFREEMRDKTLFDMREDKQVEFFGYFLDEELVALMKLVTFEMNLYGRMQPAVGLMALAVSPLYKKQGIALEMVKFYEDYAKERGASVAILLPFNMGFYRKMGYGLGSKMDEYRLPTTCLPQFRDLDNLRLLAMEDLPQVIDCYNEFVEMHHGMLKKFEEEVRAMEKDYKTFRVGYFERGKLTGYVAYQFEPTNDVNYTLNSLRVDELVYNDGETLVALLGYLRNQSDQAQVTILRTGEDNFYHLLDDPTDTSGNYIPYGYLQTNISAIGNMYKIVDPAKFVEQTSYRRFPRIGLTVCFNFTNELAGLNERLVIKFRKMPKEQYAVWEIATYDEKPDVSITCLKSDFTSILMNSAQIAPLVRLGVVDIDHPELADMLDFLLHYSEKPFSNADF